MVTTHPPTQLDTFPRTSLLDLVKASESLTSFLKALQVRMKSLMLLGNTESVSEVISTNQMSTPVNTAAFQVKGSIKTSLQQQQRSEMRQLSPTLKLSKFADRRDLRHLHHMYNYRMLHLHHYLHHHDYLHCHHHHHKHHNIMSVCPPVKKTRMARDLEIYHFQTQLLKPCFSFPRFVSRLMPQESNALQCTGCLHSPSVSVFSLYIQIQT